MAILRLLLLPIKLLGQWLKKLLTKSLLYFSKLTWKSYLSILITLFGIFGTSWSFYTYYHPDITIIQSEPLKSDNIFTSRFTIENNGNSNISSVVVGYDVKNINFSSGGNTFSNIHLIQKGSVFYKKIKSNSKQTMEIDVIEDHFVIAKNITTYSAELEWSIQYEYWFGKKSKLYTVHFYASELVDGKIVWYNTQ